MLHKIKLSIVVLVTTISYAQTSTKILIPYREHNTWCLSDTLGTIKAKTTYKDIKDFIITRNKSFVARYLVKNNKNYFVVDQNQKVILPEMNPYDSIRLNEEFPNYYWVFKKGKVGIWTANKEIVNCLYNKITPTDNKSFVVEKGELKGLVNSQSKLIIPVEYQNINSSWDEADQKNPKYVWIAEGVLVDKKFYDTKINTDDTTIGNASLIGIVDSSGGGADVRNQKLEQLRAKYDKVDFNFYNDYAIVTKDGKVGVVQFDNQEELVTPLYEEVEQYGNDHGVSLYKVKKDHLYGLIKEGNTFFLNCEYDAILDDKTLVKGKKKGMIIFNSIYPSIAPKYNSIKGYKQIDVSDTWQFSLFQVTTDKGKGLLGENGVEFFKD